MAGEIDRDFYCAQYSNPKEECAIKTVCVSSAEGGWCRCRHRKWPTPAQFEKEYGYEYPDDAGAWIRIVDDPSDSFNDWTLATYADAMQYARESEEEDYPPDVCIVVACTPFGRPPNDWMPQ